MASLDRRTFLTRGSQAVAAAGMITAVPGLASALAAGEAEAPSEAATVSDVTGEMTEPLVAHVRDLASGEITLFSGTNEVVLHDPSLASRLFRASQ